MRDFGLRLSTARRRSSASSSKKPAAPVENAPRLLRGLPRSSTWRPAPSQARQGKVQVSVSARLPPLRKTRRSQDWPGSIWTSMAARKPRTCELGARNERVMRPADVGRHDFDQRRIAEEIGEIAARKIDQKARCARRQRPRPSRARADACDRCDRARARRQTRIVHQRRDAVAIGQHASGVDSLLWASRRPRYCRCSRRPSAIRQAPIRPSPQPSRGSIQ